MRKISIKDIIKFQKYSDRKKQTFASDLKKVLEPKDNDGGGDYWISSISAISNAFKSNNNKLIVEKIDELEGKLEAPLMNRTKVMYERNISILGNYEEFDFTNWVPIRNLNYLKKYKENFVIDLSGLRVHAVPQHLFTFDLGGKEEIGAIMFIATLDGYEKEELAMFTDVLYRCLDLHYSKHYSVNKEYCIAVDVENEIDVNYKQIELGKIPKRLNAIIRDIKNSI